MANNQRVGTSTLTGLSVPNASALLVFIALGTLIALQKLFLGVNVTLN